VIGIAQIPPVGKRGGESEASVERMHEVDAVSVGSLTLAQHEALCVVAVATILRERAERSDPDWFIGFPLCKLSVRTSRITPPDPNAYRWSLRVHSATAKKLEKLGYVRIGFEGSGPTSYYSNAHLTDAGRRHLLTRWKVIEDYATDVESRSARAE
jgi:hypothetical protein